MLSIYNTVVRKGHLTGRHLIQYVGSTYSTADCVAPPRDAKVVICGGGVMGASVAYHLGKLGWGKETVLIEQNR